MKKNAERIDIEKYAYRVIWSEEDKEFVGLCTEFPSLSWLETSQEKALQGIKKLVKDVAKDMTKNDEKLPVPLSLRKYSGKLVVRMSPEVHRRLAMEAQERGISLNLFINSKLAG
jgi:predicted HicB family RNase H-like nuclease